VAVISPIFPAEVQYWGPHIVTWGRTYGLDPNLVATVMQIESCGWATARSSAGALGLFQVMPYHFTNGENPFDPDTNARRGLEYLKRALVKAGGNVEMALAGYNGGHGVIGFPNNWSPETQRYVFWGTGILRDVESGSLSSATLQQWLAAGGASLCQKAAADER